MKLNWGQSIALAMLAFMIFILSFVYKTFTNKSYDHHLVSEQYYKDEINYQQEIDAVANAMRLTENVKLVKTQKGLEIVFPTEVKGITGTIGFQRPSNTKLDLNLPVKLESNKVFISKDQLVNGLYNVKIWWKGNDTQYLFKEKYTY
jgi:nitrogen fixation protein FixH